jgi:hypothetical protein
MRRPTRRTLSLGLAAGLACAVCCIVELGLVGGVSALTVGVELSEFARLTPLLVLAVVVAVSVVVLRRRHRRHRARTRPHGAVPLPTPQVRHDAPATGHTPSRAR